MKRLKLFECEKTRPIPCGTRVLIGYTDPLGNELQRFGKVVSACGNYPSLTTYGIKLDEGKGKNIIFVRAEKIIAMEPKFAIMPDGTKVRPILSEWEYRK